MVLRSHDSNRDVALTAEKPEESKAMTSEQKSSPFTIYGKKEKHILMAILSIVGLWSTISSPIFFPALPTVARYFDISRSTSDLSVVCYLIFQGLMPTFSSSFADTIGRRPVIIASLIGFIASCIALSQTNVFWLLAVLRCFQAAAIGPVISITSGVSGDVCSLEDRGGFVGTIAGFQLTGNAFGGLIGAALIHRFNWRAIFVFLAIGAGVTVIIMCFILPETHRSVVGNGSIAPKSMFNQSPIFLVPKYRNLLTNDYDTLQPKVPLNILAPFKILLKLDTLCVLFPSGIKFAIWTMALTSINILEDPDTYNFTVLEIGYVYLAQGIFCLAGSMISGRYLNWYFKRSVKKFEANKTDNDKFNTLRPRVAVFLFPCILFVIGVAIFGWCLQYRMNVASIIISSCLIAYGSTSTISISTTIAVDLYPRQASSSASCMNVVRCILAAVGTAVIEKMTKAMGLGPCYTFWLAMSLLSDLLLVYVVIRRDRELKRQG